MSWAGKGYMLEIDDRYPEYARPYEPIKGRHRHGPLKGNECALGAKRFSDRRRCSYLACVPDAGFET